MVGPLSENANFRAAAFFIGGIYREKQTTLTITKHHLQGFRVQK